MACVNRDKPDTHRTCPVLSGDSPPGQTRTYALRHVQMSGVWTGNAAPPGDPYFPRTTP